VQYVENSSIMKGHSILLCSTRHGTCYEVADGAIRALSVMEGGILVRTQNLN